MLYLGIDIEYDGFFLNGQLHGKGKVNWDHIPYSKLRACNYEGTFVNNVIDEGIGSFRYLDSSIYTGSIKKSMRNGKGKLEFSETNNSFGLFNGYQIKAKYYDGFWVNDFMEGKGEFNYYYTLNQNNRLNNTILGDWVKNQFSGKAEIVLGNSKIYNFEFINNFPQGNGTITQGNKIKINGSFNDKFFSGSGFFTYEDGSTYEGEIKNSQKNGQGKFIDIKGNVFDGVFTDDKFTGIGEINNADWSYQGEIVLNEPMGKGVKIFSNGDTLSGTWNEYGFNGVGKIKEASIEGSDEFYYSEGTWKNGQLNGEGKRFFKMRAPDSSVEDDYFLDAFYTGQFINGLFNGKGNLEFDYAGYFSIEGGWINGLCPNGQISCTFGGSLSGRCLTTYNGDLSSDFKKQGFGTYKDCDGNIYVGYFANDSKEGQGKLTYRDGTIEQGTFVSDEFIRPIICLSGEINVNDVIWTAKNLNVSTYRNGTVIPQVQDKEKWSKLTTGAWCYYNNSTANGTTYGKLYNWYAINDPRGLAPKGYHIPSVEEWSQLYDFLEGPEPGYNDLGIQYIKYADDYAIPKLKNKTGWHSYGGVWYPQDGNGTNASGFSALPGGCRDEYLDFSNIEYDGCWWSSSDDVKFVRLSANNIGSFINTVYGRRKTEGMSVRLVKD